MTQRISAEPIAKKPTEVLRVNVDFTLFGLASTELLTGTPIVTPPTGITAGTPIVNTATFVNRRGRTVAVGKGVQFTISGGTDGTNYDIDVSCGTDGSPAQTLGGTCPVEVRTTD